MANYYLCVPHGAFKGPITECDIWKKKNVPCTIINGEGEDEEEYDVVGVSFFKTHGRDTRFKVMLSHAYRAVGGIKPWIIRSSEWITVQRTITVKSNAADAHGWFYKVARQYKWAKTLGSQCLVFNVNQACKDDVELDQFVEALKACVKVAPPADLSVTY